MAIITISRGSFAGGTAVAERLSEDLGYPILSREGVMSDVSRDFGVSDAELSKSMDGAPPFWQQVPGKRLAYVKCVSSVILGNVDDDGNLVYHGVAGHLILANVPKVLRVRVIADMAYRIQARMDADNLSEAEAVAYIQRVDKERDRWARLIYGVEWEDPSLYDLILNVGRSSVESASATIARMAEQKEFATTEESLKELEDFELSCRVWATLARNPATRSSGIQVDATDGEVVIGGTVSSVKTKELIPEIVGNVEGVKNLRYEVGVGTDWYW